MFEAGPVAPGPFGQEFDVMPDDNRFAVMVKKEHATEAIVNVVINWTTNLRSIDEVDRN